MTHLDDAKEHVNSRNNDLARNQTIHLPNGQKVTGTFEWPLAKPDPQPVEDWYSRLPDVVIVEGGPGVGKSTTAKYLKALLPRSVKIEPDWLRGELAKPCWEDTLEHFQGLRVALDLVQSWRREGRQPAIVVDTFSRGKILPFTKQLERIGLAYKAFLLVASDAAIRDRINHRGKEGFDNMGIALNLNAFAKKVFPLVPNQTMIDTTNIDAQATAHMIVAHLKGECSQDVEARWCSRLASAIDPSREVISRDLPHTHRGDARCIPSPRFLFLEVTTECPLRCKMCNMGRLCKDPADALKQADYMNLIDEFNQFPGEPRDKTVVFTGGEPFHKKELIYALASQCRALGMKSAVNSNGMYFTPRDHERLITEGPNHLVLSLDSIDPQVHDGIRDLAGHFDRQVGNMRSLVAKKKERLASGAQIDVDLVVNTIVGRWNYETLPEIVDFILDDVGMDSIMFQPLAHTFRGDPAHDPFFSENITVDAAILNNIIDRLISEKRHGRRINMQESELRWFADYFSDPECQVQPVCDSYNRNMMVSIQGFVSLCSNHFKLMNGFLDRVPGKSLIDIWESRDAAMARMKMAECRWNCGMLNCHRRQERGTQGSKIFDGH